MKIPVAEVAAVAVPMLSIGGGVLYSAIKFGNMQKDIEVLQRDNERLNTRITNHKEDFKELDKKLDDLIICVHRIEERMDK